MKFGLNASILNVFTIINYEQIFFKTNTLPIYAKNVFLEIIILKFYVNFKFVFFYG